MIHGIGKWPVYSEGTLKGVKRAVDGQGSNRGAIPLPETVLVDMDDRVALRQTVETDQVRELTY